VVVKTTSIGAVPPVILTFGIDIFIFVPGWSKPVNVNVSVVPDLLLENEAPDTVGTMAAVLPEPIVTPEILAGHDTVMMPPLDN
jgi:hypothetical protein